MQSLSNHNDGVIASTRFQICVGSSPKNKSDQSVTEVFKSILNEEIPLMLQSDKGTEFKNIQFQSLLKKYYTRFYTSENNDIKATIVEGFNRTLKARMYTYFTHSKSFKYVDVLRDLVYSYNHTYHRSIGMDPAMVSPKNEERVRRMLYHLQPKNIKLNFKVGQQVTISKMRPVFEKGYVADWSEEIFNVIDRYLTTPVTYAIKDLADEEIKGRFYEPELQLIVKEDNLYDVEKVPKTRRRSGEVEYYVKWKGYPDKFNSWTDSYSVNSANAGNSAGLNFQRKKKFLSFKCLSYTLLWSVASSTCV